MKPNRPLIVILSTVALDAVGIGLIMPVLPGLLRDLVHSNDVTAHYGILLALYALMQFACAPVLGALSDRFALCLHDNYCCCNLSQHLYPHLSVPSEN